MALLIAVQTPGHADLLGWTAKKGGDAWVFNNASTLNSSRAKASDWDNVGMFGFSLGTGKAPVAPRPTPAKKEEQPAGGGGSPASTQPTDQNPAPGGPAPTPPERPTRDPRKLVPGGN
jgi:hypothetical protein